ncbi:hypothetical protein DW966_04015 [Bacteroides stercoris]|uniref:Uncharacterized protein n=1 Tax=Bacteroides stercoris TaxID=46506 RepID=A0A412DGC6_BACSE|nr:hypothetical protein DWY65_12945 [Bacteroides stercoris]RGZ94183.1 hypothetical protein DW966_04015 [Bacteroides stercoris]
MFETFPSNDSHTALIFPLFLCTRKNVGNMKKIPRAGTGNFTAWYFSYHALVQTLPPFGTVSFMPWYGRYHALVRTVSCVGTSDMIRQLIILK